jgi:hypothetical protein
MVSLKYGDVNKIKDLFDVVFSCYQNYTIIDVLYENPFFGDVLVKVKGEAGVADIVYRVDYLNLKDSFILDLKDLKEVQ